MNYKEVMEIVNNLPVGSQLRLSFKLTAPSQVTCYLAGMVNGEILEVEDDMIWALMYAICVSGDWGGKQNRIFVVRTTVSFQPNWFVDRLYWDLESLEVVQEPQPSP